MKFIAFDKSAAEQMILRRELFSTEFSKGLSFYSLLKDGEQDGFGIHDIYFVATNSGLILFGKQQEEHNLHNIFVLDCDQSGLFNNTLSLQESLSIVQKVIRFSIRYWNNQSFPHTERILTESSKAILFPFPFSTSSNFKLVIERDVDKKRTSKRKFGRALLLYKANAEPAPAYAESPNLTAFREACDLYGKFYGEAINALSKQHRTLGQKASERAIEVFKLEQIPKTLSLHYCINNTSGILSDIQAKVMNATIDKPIKLQGAAGTGKTFTLILKSVNELQKAIASGNEIRVLFITHSEATKESISYAMSTICSPEHLLGDSKQYIRICTLYSVFLDFLHNDISQDEVLENDAQDAKLIQSMMINDCYEKIFTSLMSNSRKYLSDSFVFFIENIDKNSLMNMLMHEFSIQIKGKSSGSFEIYKDIPPLSTGIQAVNFHDKAFVFRIFTEYQDMFDALRQYDTDDIALSAYSKLNTPIWKRKRATEGYDLIFLDEAHLFNINELQSIHFLTKSSTSLPVVFAIDTAQAIGELACDEKSLIKYFCGDLSTQDEKMQTVFRSTLEIAMLSASILTAGAQVFSNLTNLYGESSFSANYIASSSQDPTPKYYLLDSDKSIISKAVDLVLDFIKTGTNPSEICIIQFSPCFEDDLRDNFSKKHVHCATIKRRGDFLCKQEAKKNNNIIFSFPEYVGGLEFDIIILLGVDKGRVPQHQEDISENYFKYLSINQLYISVSRAKQQVVILGDLNRGVSPCLEYAINNNFLDIIR